ncbi:cytochrome P450 [Penicillium sp. CMV-2018d]|nr:cytochrome P450 [Penicillium sp. CMV-2018d]
MVFTAVDILMILINVMLTEWSRTYGGFYTLKLGPVTAAVITDRQIAKEAFDRNSATSSTRHTNYATEFVTDGTHLLTMKYGALWREERKILQQTLKGSVCDNDHMRLIDAEETQLMRDLLVNPGDYSAYIKQASTSIITSLIFGIRTPSCTTLHLQELDAINDGWLQLLVIGGALSEDVFPVLKYIPSAFLGTFTKRLKGISRRGFDATTSMLLVFVQAMTLHPECQERAYVEINALCGRHRIPQWSDRNQLPYINTLLKETMRWRPVTTLSPPHVLEKIPAFVGHFYHKVRYRFDPMRYEGYTKLAADYANAPDAATRDHYTYGIGRRICPGIHLADRNMFWR